MRIVCLMLSITICPGEDVWWDRGRTAGAAIVIAPAILLNVFCRHGVLRIGWTACGVVRGRGLSDAVDRRVE